MRAAFLEAPRRIVVREVETPRPKAGEVLVRVGSCGVCGSDVHLYRDGRIGDVAVTEPHILGHEFGGVVEAAGSREYEHLVGKKVAVEPAIPCMACEVCLSGNQNCCPDILFCGLPPTQGAYRERLAWPGRLCEPVPDHLTHDQIAALEPLAIAVHVMDLAKPGLGRSAAVFGVGMIGQMILEAARKHELAPLIAVDRLPYRLEMAKAAGATHVVNAAEGDPTAEIMDITHGRGVALAFEATNVLEGPGLAVAATAHAGKVYLCGICEEAQTVYSGSIARRRGLTVYSIRRSRRTLERAIRLLEVGAFDVDRTITHTFPLEGLGEAFEMMCDYRDGILKAMIRIGR
ncbi:MAG: alcohol dehydrogenase catalytic domain-containing protein [Candidatus Sumerlaeota bacterium]|nr:alcohol dehydrogenase catalytic domain-containing protein [Candidatus Sumerlaeota bacterium]